MAEAAQVEASWVLAAMLECVHSVLQAAMGAVVELDWMEARGRAADTATEEGGEVRRAMVAGKGVRECRSPIRESCDRRSLQCATFLATAAQRSSRRP